MAEMTVTRPTERPAARLWRRLPEVALHLLLLPGVALVAGPLIWMISSSFKDESAIFALPPQLIPWPATLENYALALGGDFPLTVGYVNSLKVAILTTAGTLLTSSLAAYALAKLEFRGRDALFLALLSTLMLPAQITLIPTFVLYHRLGWLDTHLPLIVPGILTNAFGIFLLRQFIKTIPDELVDAARIDGANPIHIYWFIILPLIKPALSALAVFTFMGSWNSFLGPLIYLNSKELFTLPLMMSALRGYADAFLWGPLMAASAISLAPVLLLYLAAQRFFIEGITLSGLKG
jgi:multiple sugar transport system permease protein